MIHDLLHRFRSLLRRKSVEEELNDELRFHLEHETDKLMRRGLNHDEASRRARLAFGGLDQTKEQARDARGVRLVEETVRDLRYALRSLRRTPAFTIAAVLTIALGLGVNTAVFQLVYATLLDELPFRNPARLVHVAETHPQFPVYQVAAPDFFDWQRSATSFEGLAAHTFSEMNKWVLMGDGPAEMVQVVQASASLYPLLGVEPLLGRWYTDEEEQKKAPVVVLNESVWRRRYHADPAIIGRQIRLVGWSVTVVGIVAQHKAQPRWGEVWMPLSNIDIALTESRRFHTLEVIGRLKPGVTPSLADGELRAIAAQLARDHPDTNRDVGASVRPLSLWLTGEVRPALLIAWAAVSLVLLLACANVAHLMLVRVVHRSRELALRTALGATAARLTRFLLVESLLVTFGGAVLGIGLARLLLPWLLTRAGADAFRIESPALTSATLMFTVGAAFACAVLCLAPTFRQTRRLELQQAVQQSGGLSLAHRRSAFTPAVLGTEIALAFVVLAGAGLLYRSYAVLLAEPLGFNAGRVLAVEVPLALDWANVQSFERQVAPNLKRLPGVVEVAVANVLPMTLSPAEASRFTTRFGLPGESYASDGHPLAQLRWTTPDYFRVLRIPLRRGRLFTLADSGRAVCLINDALARRYFRGEDPVGRALIRNVGAPQLQQVTIIGVVGDVRDVALDVEPRATIYELNVSNRITLLLRTEIAPAALIPSVRTTLQAINPDAALRTIAPLEELIAGSIAGRRFALELLGIFALLASALTIVGVYGVVTYTVSHRRNEFAIRRALGAQGWQLATPIIRRFTMPTIAGLFIGGLLMLIFSAVLRTYLHKLSPIDPLTFAAVGCVILLLVAMSVFWPLVRAAGISAAAIPRE